ncbi:hypothetical protein [Amycolatopsis vastitatis]|uniref:Uncharacterized protein n=1 Tax=Amycolatopsis vastitatis TaxID=1905142 RepID=A0A229SVD7_9PSEU|nr:hypothetical protein [Amycolatopsis vastitatis]OXM63025.1 hypothetical protein CF165_32160 [Amycolatopsis vastitatis]
MGHHVRVADAEPGSKPAEKEQKPPEALSQFVGKVLASARGYCTTLRVIFSTEPGSVPRG